ncbi:uncharacterized protein LOC119718899 [Patiria miniata]|uniref:2'-5'-oligoadenylate synthetase 1 domain-containing protein n=1 Tax=Patiria miniata TaxID=46514 RepID=A0A913YXJ4_PATMI|nr:uncharacterized protein LOC119718899 [Patiria miniata]
MKVYMCLVLLMVVGGALSFAPRDDFLHDNFGKRNFSEGESREMAERHDFLHDNLGKRNFSEGESREMAERHDFLHDNFGKRNFSEGESREMAERHDFLHDNLGKRNFSEGESREMAERHAKMKVYMCLVLLMVVGGALSFAPRDESLQRVFVKRVLTEGEAQEMVERAAHADMFRAMLQLPNGYDREFYSASLAQHQLQFMERIPGHVKALIRLVKYLAYECLPDKLHKSYPLELITVYRWENAGKPQRISKAQGLKDVLQVLTNLRGLRHYWTYLYYAALANQAITQLGYINPIVLDPANPTNNACWVYQKGNNIIMIEEAARATLKFNLLKDVVVSANWKG